MTTKELRTVALALQMRLKAMNDSLAPAISSAAEWVLNAEDASLPTIGTVKAVLLAYEAFEKPSLLLYEEVRAVKTDADPPVVLPGASVPYHTHLRTEITDNEEIEFSTMADFMTGSIQMFPAGILPNQWLDGWHVCDGSAITRDCPLGYPLENAGFPYGNGDGATTMNLPNIAAPSGFQYLIYAGRAY